MQSFKDIILEKSKDFGVVDMISEMDEAGGMNAQTGGSVEGEAPTAEGEMNSAPDVEQGATVNKAPLDLPYQMLATITYKALRQSFEDMDKMAMSSIEALDPDDISSDEEGLGVIYAIRDGLDRTDGGVEPANSQIQ